MAQYFNADTITYEKKESPLSEFSWHTSQPLSDLIGAKQLDLFIRSLDPGKYSYPYHFHRNSEELFVILSGKAKLRTPEGIREVKTGDIIFFELGPAGAHQLYNHMNEPCKYLDLGAITGLDVCEYPDSEKINVLPEREIFRKSSTVDYYTDEENVAEKWKDTKGQG